MMVFAHVGFTVALFLIFTSYRKNKIGSFDIRLLLIGAMLPDIIDKTLSLNGISPGRGYAHTLAFFLAILYLSSRYNKTELAFGNLTHLLLDFMFLEPTVFLWPLYGISLPFVAYGSHYYWNLIFTNGFIQVTETLGIVCIIYISLRYGLYTKHKLVSLIKYGSMGTSDSTTQNQEIIKSKVQG